MSIVEWSLSDAGLLGRLALFLFGMDQMDNYLEIIADMVEINFVETGRARLDTYEADRSRE